MRNQKKAGVISALKAAVRSHRILTVSTLLCVAASVAASLIPPLLLKNIIDRLTGGMPLLFTAVLLYFGSLVLEGTLYPILYRLEDDGLIEAVWQQETGRAAPRKIYSATEKGREENERRLGLWAGFRTAVDHFCGEDAGHE